MLRTRFEQRRALEPTVGLVRDVVRDGEQVEWIDPEFKPLLELAETRARVDADEIPLPATADREGYFDERHFAYWISGLHDWRTLLERVPGARDAGTIVDFGGASGRVVRHMLFDAPANRRVYLAELNINHVEFVARHFPPSVVPLKVGSAPHLMLPDASCDIACAFSVFTHMDVFETSWLAELRRVVRPGGHALITVHSEHTWARLEESHVLVALRGNPEFVKVYRPGSPMPAERLVFEFAEDDEGHHYNTNVFHGSDYVHRVWGRFFDVVEIVPCVSVSRQTAVVLRRTDDC